MRVNTSDATRMGRLANTPSLYQLLHQPPPSPTHTPSTTHSDWYYLMHPAVDRKAIEWDGITPVWRAPDCCIHAQVSTPAGPNGEPLAPAEIYVSLTRLKIPQPARGPFEMAFSSQNAAEKASELRPLPLHPVPQPPPPHLRTPQPVPHPLRAYRRDTPPIAPRPPARQRARLPRLHAHAQVGDEHAPRGDGRRHARRLQRVA